MPSVVTGKLDVREAVAAPPKEGDAPGLSDAVGEPGICVKANRFRVQNFRSVYPQSVLRSY